MSTLDRRADGGRREAPRALFGISGRPPVCSGQQVTKRIMVRLAVEGAAPYDVATPTDFSPKYASFPLFPFSFVYQPQGPLQYPECWHRTWAHATLVGWPLSVSRAVKDLPCSSVPSFLIPHSYPYPCAAASGRAPPFVMEGYPEWTCGPSLVALPG